MGNKEIFIYMNDHCSHAHSRDANTAVQRRMFMSPGSHPTCDERKWLSLKINDIPIFDISHIFYMDNLNYFNDYF